MLPGYESGHWCLDFAVQPEWPECRSHDPVPTMPTGRWPVRACPTHGLQLRKETDSLFIHSHLPRTIPNWERTQVSKHALLPCFEPTGIGLMHLDLISLQTGDPCIHIFPLRILTPEGREPRCPGPISVHLSPARRKAR